MPAISIQANYKSADDYAGKRVLVVGFGNTAADVTGLLADVAEQVYVSHRHGAIVVSLEPALYPTAFRYS